AAVVERHLGSCVACCQRIDALLKSPPGLSNLRPGDLDQSEREAAAIRAQGARPPVPQDTGTIVGRSHAVSLGGLWLDAPRDPRYKAALGAFDVIGVLGEGGMGVVFRAHDPRLGRDVALKLVCAKRTEDARRTEDRSALERFFKEGRAVAQLSHPNII